VVNVVNTKTDKVTDLCRLIKRTKDIKAKLPKMIYNTNYQLC